MLQGAYEWREGDSYGYDWKDIPTVLEGEGAMKLQTLDEYRAQHPQPDIEQERWKPIGVACPICGHEMLWDSWTSLTSYPPKQYWQCSDCGHVEYV